MGRTVRDSRLFKLLDRVLQSGAGLYARPELLGSVGLEGIYQPEPRKGLPIGNLTSQLFANVYLDGLDHFVKRELKAPHAVRYMDNVVLFGPSRGVVRAWAGACIQWLREHRRLEVHDRVQPLPCRQPLRFLGYVVSRDDRRVAGANPAPLRRLKARVRGAVLAGASPRDLDDLTRSVASRLGGLLF